MLVRTAAAFAVCLALAVSASAQRSTLEVGSTAPGLDIEEWFNGSGTSIEPGSVYVVEFWATWCAPCRKSIPHLNEMHQRWSTKGLTIIGVSDEKVSTVQNFLAKQGDRMSYLVGVDRKENTKKAWMRAAKKSGIPCAFVVDQKGKIVFIGNPLDPKFDDAVTLTLQGRYDPKLTKAAEPHLAAAKRAAKVRNFRQAYKHLDEVIAMDQSVFAPIALDKFEMMLVEEGDSQKAYDYARELVVTYAGDPMTLSELAEKITIDPVLEERDLDVALLAAEATLQAAGKQPEALATLALVNFHRGEVNEAIEHQMEAWMVAVPAEKGAYKRTLDNYRAAADRKAAR